MNSRSARSARTSRQPNPTDVAATRRRLLEAAREEFSERGIEGATTRRIAQRARCNEVTLFRHFETKQKLLAAAVEETSGELRALCECGRPGNGDLLEDLEWYARKYNDSLERHEGMARAIIGEGRRRPLLAKEMIGDTIHPFHERVAGYLRQQQALGRVRGDLDVHGFSEVFTATLMTGVLRRTSGLSTMNRDQWIRQVITSLVEGIR